MNYPIVRVETSDRILLFGLLAESQKRTTILINIHGTASGFYIEEFEQFFIEDLPPKGISVLFTNNRGNFVMESWQKTGAAVERFEDCVLDVDAWIKFALNKGYKDIILQGHSLGSEKVVYYMNRGKYRNKVRIVSLLGFSDSYGNQIRFAKEVHKTYMKEAQALIDAGKGGQFLTTNWRCHAGILPKSAESYVNFFSDDSELSKALPLRNEKKLPMYANIRVPIIAVVGDKDQWTILPVPEAAELMGKENRNAEVHIISDCTHSFEGKQNELVQIVYEFIKKF